MRNPTPDIMRCTQFLRWVMLSVALAITAANAVARQQPPSDVRPFRFGPFETSLTGLGLPSGAAIGEDGSIFIVDAGTHQVLVYSRSGDRLRAFGTLGSAPGQLHSPTSIASGTDGLLYVADTGNDRVQVFTAAGNLVRAWGKRGQGDGEFCSPLGIAAKGDRIVVADTGNQRLQEFGVDGRFVRSLSGSTDGSKTLKRPVAVAIDHADRIFAVDADQDSVFVFDSGGAFIRAFGDYGPFAGLLNDAQGITCFGGQVLLADTSNHRVQFFTETGEMKKQWGIHDPISHEGNGRIHYPHDVAIAPDGSFAVICEPREHRCQVFRGLQQGDPDEPRQANSIADQTHFGQRLAIDGRLLLIPEPEHHFIYVLDLMREGPVMINQSGQRGTKFGMFIRPTGIIVDEKTRTTMVADPSLARVQTFSLDFKPDETLKYDPYFARFVRSVDFTHPRFAKPAPDMHWPLLPEAIRRDAQGNLHVLDMRNAMIIVFDSEMNFVRAYGGYGSDAGELLQPTDFAFSPDGQTVYVADAGNLCVQAYDMQGRPTIRFGTAGDGDGQFRSPFGIAVDKTGAVFVSDALADRVQKFDADGAFVKAWGKRGLEHGEFWRPLGMGIDGRDRLFVVDHGNHRAQMFTLDGDWLGTFGAGKSTMKSQLAE